MGVGRPRLLWPGAALLVVALLLGTADADEPATGWQSDGSTFVGSDGRIRKVIRPEFESAPGLKLDLDSLKIPGLDVRLVTPMVAVPGEEGKPPPPRVPGRLMLVGERAVVEKALAHLAHLDVPPRMASVSMLISEVVCTCQGSRGAVWSFAKTDGNDTLFRGFDTRFDPETWLNSELTGARPFTGTSLDFAKTDTLGGAWEGTLRMLMKHKRAEIFNWPHVMCSEEWPAYLESLETIRYLRPITTRVTPDRVDQSTELRAQEVGLVLEILPTSIGTDAAVLDLVVRLRIPEAMEGAGSRPMSLGLRDRRLATRVTVRDGEPLLLGGLYMRRFASIHKGIPVIERMTLLDAVTGAHDKEVIDTELIFLIRVDIKALGVPVKGIEFEPFPDLFREPHIRIPNRQPISTWSERAPHGGGAQKSGEGQPAGR